jgi:ABC-type branched-subunit amino acid transport system permease subunit
MEQAVYYLATLAIFFFVYNILTWGLNIQFGYAGILDFTYITFFAAGAYFAGAASLGRPGPDSDMRYILGLGWPFLPSLVLGAAVAGCLGSLIGLVVLNRLRSDYLAIVTVSVGTIAYDLVGNDARLFNGWDGIAGVPYPFNAVLGLDPNTYTLFYVGFSGVVMAVLWFFAHRLYASPLGRAMRATREDADVAEAFGKNTFAIRMTAMVIGCVYAGVAGALLIGFISALNPGGWTAGETFVVWAAMLVGGRGNNLGAVVGSLLVPVVFNEATRFLPPIPGHPALIPAIRNMLIGLLLILVLWFRPEGILPERKPAFFEVPVRPKADAVESHAG